MRGEFIAVWAQTWDWIWLPLAQWDDAPNDIFCELYRPLVKALHFPPTIEQLADIIDDPATSLDTFQKVVRYDLIGECALVQFLESAGEVLDDLGGDPLSNHYFNLMGGFIDKFSLRYDLRRPFNLCPTLTGLFANLIRELRIVTSGDPHLATLMHEYEDAVRDLRDDSRDGRIKTCIQKQVNLLEALGRTFPGVTGNTLGAICNQITSWPHEKLKEAIKNLYGFTCDYPGIRHGGTAASALRDIEMRDMIACSILLAGFVPYLSHTLDGNTIYRGT